MRIFIGGVSNGKRAYVKKLLENEGNAEVQWFEGCLPEPGKNPVVIAGIERWLLETNLQEAQAIQYLFDCCKQREVIFILTDLGRGIVPIDKKQRQLRDSCGRLYQQLFSEAVEVIRIWYGLSQRLKGGNDDENLYENRG